MFDNFRGGPLLIFYAHYKTAEGHASFFRCLSDGRVIINDFGSSCLITFMDTAQMHDASTDNHVTFLSLVFTYVGWIRRIQLINKVTLLKNIYEYFVRRTFILKFLFFPINFFLYVTREKYQIAINYLLFCTIGHPMWYAVYIIFLYIN